jgi:hypothetical protein
MSRMRFSWSTTTMLSRRCCTMYCDSCASWRGRPAAGAPWPRCRAGGAPPARPAAPPGTRCRRGCRGGVVRGVARAGDDGADLLRQQRECGERGQHEGVAAVGQQCHGAHRHHEQDAEAAGDAAAREHQQADATASTMACTKVVARRLGSRRRPPRRWPRRGEIHDAGPEEQSGRALPRRSVPPEAVDGVDRTAESAVGRD